jgi:hypothetical protein
MMLVVACASVILPALLLVASPKSMGGPLEPVTPTWTWLLTGAGVFGLVIGFAWMIRIYRADPEGTRSSWRFDRS